MNGQSVAKVDDIQRLLTSQPAASPLKLTMVRDQDRLELLVMPGEV